jgi:hypothetical protein
MDTVVVHVKNVSLDDASVAYIGRGGRGREGTFGNPHPVGRCSICNTSHDREGSIAAYKQYFWQRVNEDREFLAEVLKLQGKKLACFCTPKACHGDIIKAFLDWVTTDEGKAWERGAWGIAE